MSPWFRWKRKKEEEQAAVEAPAQVAPPESPAADQAAPTDPSKKRRRGNRGGRGRKRPGVSTVGAEEQAVAAKEPAKRERTKRQPQERRAQRVVHDHVRVGADVFGPRTLALQVLALDCSTSEVVLRQVHDRASQVRLEGIRVAEEPEPTHEADERLLDEVLSDGPVTGQQVREPDASGRRPNVGVGEPPSKADLLLHGHHPTPIVLHIPIDTRPACFVAVSVQPDTARSRALLPVASCRHVRIPPELADPVGSLEVGEHQDVEEFGALSGAERVQALAEAALKLLGAHER